MHIAAGQRFHISQIWMSMEVKKVGADALRALLGKAMLLSQAIHDMQQVGALGRDAKCA